MLGRTVLVFLVVFCAAAPAAAQRCVEITADRADIVTVPGGGQLVGQAQRGDVFELEGRHVNWYAIRMFSGGFRYVRSTDASPTDSLPPPAAEVTRRQAFRAVLQAEDRAREEADGQFPGNTGEEVGRNIILSRILEDRHKLATLRGHDLQPAHYEVLRLEGLTRGWAGMSAIETETLDYDYSSDRICGRPDGG